MSEQEPNGGAASGGLPRQPEDFILAPATVCRGLVCPACTRPLVDGAIDHTGKPGTVTCVICDTHWPVWNGVPVFTGARHPRLVAGAAALLRAADGRDWTALKELLARADPALYREAFGAGGDAWRWLLPIPAYARALVLGCGWGRVAVELSGCCERVYAADEDDARVRFVNTRALAETRGNLAAVVAGLSNLPFPRGQFHLVVVDDPALLARNRSRRGGLADLVRLRSLLCPEGLLLLHCRPYRDQGVPWLHAWRWSRLLKAAGFAQVEDLLALPNTRPTACVAHWPQGRKPDADTQAWIARHAAPWGLRTRATRAFFSRMPMPSSTRWLFPGHWLLAGLQEDRLLNGARACSEAGCPECRSRTRAPRGNGV